MRSQIFKPIIEKYFSQFPIDHEVEIKQEYLGAGSIFSGLLEEKDRENLEKFLKDEIVLNIFKYVNQELEKLDNHDLKLNSFFSEDESKIREEVEKLDEITLNYQTIVPEINIFANKKTKELIIESNCFYINRYDIFTNIEDLNTKSFLKKMLQNFFFLLIFLNPILTNKKIYNDDNVLVHQNEFYEKSKNEKLFSFFWKNEIKTEFLNTYIKFSDFYWNEIKIFPFNNEVNNKILFRVKINSFDPYRFSTIASYFESNLDQIKKEINQINNTFSFNFKII